MVTKKQFQLFSSPALFARLLKAIENLPKPKPKIEKSIPNVKKPRVGFYRKSRRRVRFYKKKKVNLGIYALAQSLYKTTDELKSLRGKKMKHRKYNIYYYPRKKMSNKAKCRYIQNKLLKERRQNRQKTLQRILEEKRGYKVIKVKKYYKKYNKFIIKKKIVPIAKIISRKKKINNATYVVFKRKHVKKKYYNHANGSIVLDLLTTTQLLLGEKIDKKNKNMDIINNYVIITKNQHAVFDAVDLMDNIRLSLRMLLARLRFKGIIAVNSAKKTTGSQISKPNIFKRMPDNFLKLAVKYYMVTWNKWMGGSLTNFKALGKQYMSLKRNKASTAKIQDISHPLYLPKLPSMFFSTTNHHYALNESTRLRLPSVQLINTAHLGPRGTIPLAMNMHYLGVRTFTSLLNNAAVFTEHNFKMPYKNKFLRQIRRQANWFGRLRKKYKAYKKPRSVSTFFILIAIIIIAMGGFGNNGKQSAKLANLAQPAKNSLPQHTPRDNSASTKTTLPLPQDVNNNNTMSFPNITNTNNSNRHIYENKIPKTIRESFNDSILVSNPYVKSPVTEQKTDSVIDITSTTEQLGTSGICRVNNKNIEITPTGPVFKKAILPQSPQVFPTEVTGKIVVERSGDPIKPTQKYLGSLVEQNSVKVAEVMQTDQLSLKFIRNMLASMSSGPKLEIRLGISNLIENQDYKHALIGCVIVCDMLGIRRELVYIVTNYSVGNAGTNATYLQELSGHRHFKEKLNFKDFFPEDVWNSLNEKTKALLEELKASQIGTVVEVATMCRTNEDLETPLEYNDNQQSNAKMRNTNTQQNNSGNPCPDFFRRLDPAIDEVILEGYNHKFSKLAKKNKNHVRHVSDDLGKHVEEANKQVKQNLVDWLEQNPNHKDSAACDLFLEDLQTSSAIYADTPDANSYASVYNNLKDKHNEFIVKHKIPMNLVKEVGLEHFDNIDKESAEIFKKIFLFLYEHANSPLRKLSKYKNLREFVDAFCKIIKETPPNA